MTGVATVHVIGAGLAGLSAAVALEQAGIAVRVHEAAGHAGGRCRSFHDKALDRTIDNGNHLLLSGNGSALAYLDAIGSVDALTGPETAAFPFVDGRTGARWMLRPNDGPVPWWVMSPGRRVPDTHSWDYLPGLRIPFAAGSQTVTDLIPAHGPLYERFWEPFVVAVLNTPPEKAAAALLWPVLRETFLKGGEACRPLIAREGLGPAFVDPAVRMFAATNRPIRFNARLREMERADGRIAALAFADTRIALEPRDMVILAVPPARARDLVPGLDVPEDGETILNVHFRLSRPAPSPGGVGVVGLINAHAQWAFVRGDMVSLTVSAAGALADRPSEELLEIFWPETRLALGLEDTDYVAARIIKERRATFDQSPAGVAKRPGTQTAWANLLLAGDWTDTGLPATIEGAIRSGRRAAELARARIARL